MFVVVSVDQLQRGSVPDLDRFVVTAAGDTGPVGRMGDGSDRMGDGSIG